MEELGAGEIVLTSMDADGTKAGYDVPMTSAVARAVSIPVVASGGAGCPQHLFEVLTKGGADAALAASIFHYNEYGLTTNKVGANSVELFRYQYDPNRRLTSRHSAANTKTTAANPSPTPAAQERQASCTVAGLDCAVLFACTAAVVLVVRILSVWAPIT